MPHKYPNTLLMALGLSLFAGCASDPIVNRSGVDEVTYQRDLNECESYADQVKVAQKLSLIHI